MPRFAAASRAAAAIRARVSCSQATGSIPQQPMGRSQYPVQKSRAAEAQAFSTSPRRVVTDGAGASDGMPLSYIVASAVGRGGPGPTVGARRACTRETEGAGPGSVRRRTDTVVADTSRRRFTPEKRITKMLSTGLSAARGTPECMRDEDWRESCCKNARPRQSFLLRLLYASGEM